MNTIKNKIKIFVATAVLTGTMFSCDSYLDKKDEDQLTFEKIWMKRDTTLQYFSNVFSYLPKEWEINNNHPFSAASDDLLQVYARDYNKVNLGTWSPASPPYNSHLYTRPYQGIREASIFINNVESCSAEDVTQEEIQRWKAEARFVRAFQYFLLLRTYGPIILTGDEPVDITKPDMNAERSTLDDCISYIVNELEECMEKLPTKFTSDETGQYGRPTKGAAMAIIGRLRLYAARPLFNGNTLYKDVKNPDGTALFPLTYDANKWKLAADANKALIDFSETNGVYKLYTHPDNDPVLNYQGVFLEDFNDELIFAQFVGRYEIQVLLTPGVVGGTAYGGVGATQFMVDSYAMSNGRYPITGYRSNGEPIIDTQSGYNANEFAKKSFVHPVDNINGAALQTPNMYIDREPRFYASVMWSGALWPYKAAPKYPNYSYNGNSGPGPRHDFTKTGYMVRKYINPTVNSAAGTWGNMTWVMFRLAEIYLNYAEALNESNPGHPDILKYMNLVRERSGMPNIEAVYPGADQLKMRELIQKERQIELFFETHRYFDTRQWMTVAANQNGPVYGMNIMAVASNQNETPDDFWQRTVQENRIFKPAYYLYPFAESEITKNHSLVQNYGW